MGTWTERLVIAAIAAIAAILVVVSIGMYATWRDCKAAGGTTVSGVFRLECIKPCASAQRKSN